MGEYGRSSEVEVVCLLCGHHRVVSGTDWNEVGECDRCGYVGWRPLDEVETESARRGRGSA